MITHVGGINAVADATCHLPEIPGDKKLTYIQFDMPLTAIDDFEELGKPRTVECRSRENSLRAFWRKLIPIFWCESSTPF